MEMTDYDSRESYLAALREEIIEFCEFSIPITQRRFAEMGLPYPGKSVEEFRAPKITDIFPNGLPYEYPED